MIFKHVIVIRCIYMHMTALFKKNHFKKFGFIIPQMGMRCEWLWEI